jgi:hypothetical protein
MMSVEQSVEWELVRETEVLGENLPQFHYVQKFHMTWPGLEPGPLRWDTGVRAKETILYRTVKVEFLSQHVHTVRCWFGSSRRNENKYKGSDDMEKLIQKHKYRRKDHSLREKTLFNINLQWNETYPTFCQETSNCQSSRSTEMETHLQQRQHTIVYVTAVCIYIWEITGSNLENDQLPPVWTKANFRGQSPTILWRCFKRNFFIC